MQRSPAKLVNKKVTTLSMRCTKQDQGNNSPAGNSSQNNDLLDDLRVSGTKAKATFGSKKIISTLNLHTQSKKKLDGGASPRNTTLNKWNNRTDGSYDMPSVTHASPRGMG